MLVKLGVDISRLQRPIRRSLNVIERIYRRYGYEPVITSTYEGDHMPSSLHYANLAVDVRLPPSNIQAVLYDLRRALNEDYDVVLEKDHIHIEYDPKKGGERR